MQWTFIWLVVLHFGEKTHTKLMIGRRTTVMRWRWKTNQNFGALYCDFYRYSRLRRCILPGYEMLYRMNVINEGNFITFFVFIANLEFIHIPNFAHRTQKRVVMIKKRVSQRQTTSTVYILTVLAVGSWCAWNRMKMPRHCHSANVVIVDFFSFRWFIIEFLWWKALHWAFGSLRHTLVLTP